MNAFVLSFVPGMHTISSSLRSALHPVGLVCARSKSPTLQRLHCRLDDHHHVALLPSLPVRVKNLTNRMQVAGQRIMHASSCVVLQGRQTDSCVPVQDCNRKSIVRSLQLHPTEQRAVAATAPPASGQAPQSPSPTSVLTHARARPRTHRVVVVASSAGTDRTCTHSHTHWRGGQTLERPVVMHHASSTATRTDADGAQ